MTKKRRLVLCASFVCLILAIGVAVVTVLALNQQKVTASFNVAYMAGNRSASVSAQYKMAQGNWSSLFSSTGEEKITFARDSASNNLSSSFKPGTEISLTAESDFAVFQYILINQDESTLTVDFQLNKSAFGADLQLYYCISEDALEEKAFDSINNAFSDKFSTSLNRGVKYVYILAKKPASLSSAVCSGELTVIMHR